MKTTPLYPAEKYTYRGLWSEEDQQYIGACSEFPSISHLADAHDEALTGVVAVVRAALDAMHKSKQETPVPLSITSFKGLQ